MLNFSRTRLQFDRPITSYSKVQSALSHIIRNRKLFAPRPRSGAYLNVGCGPYPRAGFINIDYAWRPGVNLCWDITRGLPIDSESSPGIFSEHCIEHIDIAQFRELANEFYRVLCPRGVARIIVPDGGLYVRRYLAAQPLPYADDDMVASDIYTPFMSVNRIFYGCGHRFIYDFETLALVLRRAGFQEVNRCSFATGRDPQLLIDTPARAVESLYVEALRTV